MQTSVGKVISLLFNTLSRFIIAFLPRSKESFNFMVADTIHSDFGTQENKDCHCFHIFPIYLPGSNESRDITLPTKVHIVKTMVFPVVMYGCETWTVKKTEHQRIDVLELWC